MLAAMLSIVVHAAFLITLADSRMDTSGITDREPLNRELSVSFQRPAPPQVVQQEKPKPRITPTPKPQPKPEPRPEVKPMPTARPEVTESQDVGEAIMASDTRKQQQQSYLSRIVAMIERNKHYPRLARRRGREGNVRVNFMVLNDGTISSLSLEGGHQLLSAAARSAIKKSIPLPTPPITPYEAKFTMRFELH